MSLIFHHGIIELYFIVLHKFGKDPDAIEGVASQPQWLSLLLLKVEKKLGHHQGANTVDEVTGKLGRKVTVGQFAAFLSSCVMGTFPLTEEERDAFVIVSKIKFTQIILHHITYNEFI